MNRLCLWGQVSYALIRVFRFEVGGPSREDEACRPQSPNPTVSGPTREDSCFSLPPFGLMQHPSRGGMLPADVYPAVILNPQVFTESYQSSCLVGSTPEKQGPRSLPRERRAQNHDPRKLVPPLWAAPTFADHGVGHPSRAAGPGDLLQGGPNYARGLVQEVCS